MRKYEKTDIDADNIKQYQRIYHKKYYEENKEKKRQYIKSGHYTKENLLKEKLLKEKLLKDKDKNIIYEPDIFIEYDKEGIIKEDKHYIFYKDKIYSKTQFKYLNIYNTRKRRPPRWDPYCTLLKSSYDENDKHMNQTKSYVKYYFLR